MLCVCACELTHGKMHSKSVCQHTAYVLVSCSIPTYKDINRVWINIVVNIAQNSSRWHIQVNNPHRGYVHRHPHIIENV